jgi:hypothetical protein
MSGEAVLDNSEATMLARAFDAEKGNLPRDAARVLLQAKVSEADTTRMVYLGERAQNGKLTAVRR